MDSKELQLLMQIQQDVAIIRTEAKNTNDHLEKLNSKVAKHEEKFHQLDLKQIISDQEHITKCPHTLTVKKLEENYITKKHLNKFLYKALGVFSLLMGIWVAILKVFL